MKTIFTQKSVVLEYVPIEKGSLVVYAGTAKKFTEKNLKNAQSCCFASHLWCCWSSSYHRRPRFVRSQLATRKWGVCWCCGKD